MREAECPDTGGGRETRRSVLGASVGPVTDHVFRGELYLATDEPGSWVFVDLPEWLADEVAAAASPTAFGSVRVQVRLGPSSWETSVFPSKARGTYLLPVRASARRAAGVEAGDEVEVTISL